MSDETVEYLRTVLDDRGLSLPEKNLASAAATHDKLRHEFEKLNSLELRFLPPLHRAGDGGALDRVVPGPRR